MPPANPPFHFRGYPTLSGGRLVELKWTLPAHGTRPIWSRDREAVKRHHEPAPGTYRAKDLVAMFGPLLDTVILKLGPDSGAPSAQDILLDGLARILDTKGSESSLPLDNGGSTGDNGGTARVEMRKQAMRIGKQLVAWAEESLDPEHADPNLAFTSHCDGHRWSLPVQGVLMGRRSNSVLMMLYNEWSHRLVLLRDSLLPFENFEEVPIVVAPGNERKGPMRELETPRKSFLMELLSGQVSQRDIVELAKALTVPKNGRPLGGYGFQTANGSVLPAFLDGSTSKCLLRWYPVQLADKNDIVTFDYQYESYEEAERSDLRSDRSSVRTEPEKMIEASLTANAVNTKVQANGDRAVLDLTLKLSNAERSFVIDLGQAARGRRYASYLPGTSTQASGDDNGAETLLGNGGDAFSHSTVEEVLSQPGLVVSAKSGGADKQDATHVVPYNNSLVALALFGKLYPGNIVVCSRDCDGSLIKQVGRGFGTKFVLVHV